MTPPSVQVFQVASVVIAGVLSASQRIT